MKKLTIYELIGVIEASKPHISFAKGGQEGVYAFYSEYQKNRYEEACNELNSRTIKKTA